MRSAAPYQRDPRQPGHIANFTQFEPKKFAIVFIIARLFPLKCNHFKGAWLFSLARLFPLKCNHFKGAWL